MRLCVISQKEHICRGGGDSHFHSSTTAHESAEGVVKSHSHLIKLKQRCWRLKAESSKTLNYGLKSSKDKPTVSQSLIKRTRNVTGKHKTTISTESWTSWTRKSVLKTVVDVHKKHSLGKNVTLCLGFYFQINLLNSRVCLKLWHWQLGWILNKHKIILDKTREDKRENKEAEMQESCCRNAMNSFVQTAMGNEWYHSSLRDFGLVSVCVYVLP